MKNKPLIELITCEDGDWEILRLNEGKDYEYSGHSIPNFEWIELLNILGYEVEEKIVSEEEIEEYEEM